MPEELYDLTFREFAHKIEGQNEINELHYKQRMEAARFTASLVISSLAGKSIAPSDLVRLPWEEGKKKVKVMDRRKFAKLKKAINNIG